ncbi:sulfite exporter TauE/SafE family protein [Paenibacillus sp. N4]|uniref:sulfite exporter TauE/SafE family protein n=1 Tax=Paenibacillus vietnamensis TaxID=2590547 RepID=UPI001CD0A9E5|nr:sulfite exporter TauE/SafE family protein [Paenibacillus vietnamensis]MCA0753525.1 sulfite exporter TauE/SafE family protein [Paenibacillus vietnamensis]
MSELNVLQIIIVIAAAFCCGFAKTGIATLGVFNAVLMMQAFSAKESVGMLLPMLIAADIAAVIVYRRHVVWKHLLPLLPWVLAGLAGGYMLLSVIDDAMLRRFLGCMLLALAVIQLLKEYGKGRFRLHVPESAMFTASMGALAGFATMVGNVSGVVMSMYLLGKKLPKEVFIGTGAWFYLTVNLIKLPFFVKLDMITEQSLLINLWMLPAIAAGICAGVYIIPRVKQSQFQFIVLMLGAAGALVLAVQ